MVESTLSMDLGREVGLTMTERGKLGKMFWEKVALQLQLGLKYGGS